MCWATATGLHPHCVDVEGIHLVQVAVNGFLRRGAADAPGELAAVFWWRIGEEGSCFCGGGVGEMRPGTVLAITMLLKPSNGRRILENVFMG